MRNNKKARKSIKPLLLVLSIAFVLALGVVGTVKANVGGVTDKSIDGLVACLVNNPDHAVCSTLVRVLDTLLPEEDVLGGVLTRAQATAITVFPSLGLSDPDNESLVVNQACRNFDLPNASSTAALLTNRSQQDLLITFTDLHILKAPSATIVFLAGTSTANAVPFNEALRGNLSTLNALYNHFVIVTSTMEDAHITNLRLTTSSIDTEPQLASNTAANASCARDSNGCRVGRSEDPTIVLNPNVNLLLHVESSDKRNAVTTTVTDTNYRGTEGDIGLRARFTVCWLAVSTTTPQ